MGKYRPRQGPNLPTVQKIKQLVEYREVNRDQWGRPPSLNSACKKIGIAPGTVRRQAPDLFQNWTDETFRW